MKDGIIRRNPTTRELNMMKALKVGLLGLAMGVIGAVAFPTQVAEAQGVDDPAQQFGCCSFCNPSYQRCLTSAGNNTTKIAQCVSQRSSCETTCNRGC